MSRAARLLPHERVCSECDQLDHGLVGERPGYIWSYKHGGEWITCPTCDGTRVEVCENREPHNAALRVAVDEAMRHYDRAAEMVRGLYARLDDPDCARRRADLRAYQAERECDRLRVILQAQQRLLDKAKPEADVRGFMPMERVQ